jgi:hypothetical protein
LRDKPSLQDLLGVQRQFELPSPVLVEKDWYVVTALAVINIADVKPFRLVFSGGTASSRAHRLIRRMSEDIDLKIVSDGPRSRSELRKLRDVVTGALLHSLILRMPHTANPATRAAIRSITCPMQRRSPVRGRCDQKSKSRQPCGHCAYHPSNEV